MKRSILISTLATISLVGMTTWAQPSPDKNIDPRRVEADALYQEGNRLHNRNMEAEALDKFQKAYALYPSPNILLNLARQEHLLGEHLKAIRHYREAMRNPLLAPFAAELGKKYVAELEPSFARVDLKGPLGMVVTLGQEKVTLPLPEPLDVEPGKVTATGVMDGRRYDASATVAAGQLATIWLQAAEAQKRKETAERKEENYWTSQHITGVALGGAAVVAAGLGIGFMAAHNSHASNANSLSSANSNVCRDQASDACGDYRNKVDSAKNAKTGEIVSFVAAGALAVGAVVLLVPWQNKEGARVGARLVPTGQGFLIDGAF